MADDDLFQDFKDLYVAREAPRDIVTRLEIADADPGDGTWSYDREAYPDLGKVIIVSDDDGDHIGLVRAYEEEDERFFVIFDNDEVDIITPDEVEKYKARIVDPDEDADDMTANKLVGLPGPKKARDLRWLRWQIDPLKTTGRTIRGEDIVEASDDETDLDTSSDESESDDGVPRPVLPRDNAYRRTWISRRRKAKDAMGGTREDAVPEATARTMPTPPRRSSRARRKPTRFASDAHIVAILATAPARIKRDGTRSMIWRRPCEPGETPHKAVQRTLLKAQVCMFTSIDRLRETLSFEVFDTWDEESKLRIERMVLMAAAKEGKPVSIAEPVYDPDGKVIPKFSVPIPKNYKDAVNHPIWGPYWREAIRRELESWEINGVLASVAAPPRSRTRVTSRYVFTVKQDHLGRVVRFKCRLVARGFSQRPGLDFDEVYAPVVKQETINSLLALAAADGDRLHQYDVKTAYLHGVIPKGMRIYFDPPPGMPSAGIGKAWMFRRSAYGLKQAGYLWNVTLDRRLKSIGFLPSIDDPCLYLRTESDGAITAIAVYVDDLIVKVARHRSSSVGLELAAIFDLKDMGECNSILGMHIKRDDEAGTITVEQRRYLEDVLKRFDYTGRSYVTPGDEAVIYGRYMSPPAKGEESLTETVPPRRWKHTDDELEFVRQFQYREKVGSLLYVAIRARPDIANAVRLAAKYSAYPGILHCKLIDRILGYIQGTLDYTVVYGGQRLSDLTLDVWSDADWAYDPDSRYSVSGTVIICNGGIIYTKSKGQTCVAQSTMESEYIAASDSVQRAVPIVRTLRQLGLDLPTESVRLLMDSNAAMAYIDAPRHNWRNSHIDRRYHFVRDLYRKHEFSLLKVKTEWNLADICTKCSKTNNHKRIRELIFRIIDFPDWTEVVETVGTGVYHKT